MDIGTVTDNVTDSVTDKSTGRGGCDGSDGKSCSLFNLELQLELVEYYTTGMEKELEEKDNLKNNPSPASAEEAQKTEDDRLQENGNKDNEPAPTVTNTVPDDEDEGLKVGDKVIYVGKKYQESIGNQVMEVVKISVHWTGNLITCSYDRGWTTWLTENSLKKAEPQR
ncbi:MAG: hypothetical protein AB4368_12835 [Xenococcaceae cyanobacterium]